MAEVPAPRGGGRRVRNSNHPQLPREFWQAALDYLRPFSRKREKEEKQTKHSEIKACIKMLKWYFFLNKRNF